MSCRDTEPDQSGNLQEIRVGIADTYQGEAATFVAIDRGFFEKNGLKVILKLNPSGQASFHDLLDGDVQIAHVAETPVIYTLLDTTFHEGASIPHFQIFADMIFSHQIQKVIARKDHGITEPLDIVGKKVALLRGTQLDYFFDSFLLEHQISKDEIDTVNMNPSEQLESIKNGEIDVAVTWEPYATHIQNQLGDKAAYLPTDLIYSTLWMATTLDSFAESNPNILTAYLKSIKEAQEYIRQNPAYTQQLLADETNIPVQVVESLWSEIDYELSLSERMLTLLEDQARWMYRNKLANTEIQNLEELVNFSPMQEVHPRGITVVR